jgi:hypothetical protein
MIKKLSVVTLFVVLLSGCSGGSNSSNSSETSASESRLFGGKCESNQAWMSELVDAITIPADWQAVYSLVNKPALEGFWGIGDTGSTFTMEENAEWSVYTARLGSAVVQSNYSEAVRMYDLLYPLMEKMDLQCGVAVTGKAALSTTILP